MGQIILLHGISGEFIYNNAINFNNIYMEKRSLIILIIVILNYYSLNIFSQNNDYKWVDLALPSGTKWATCNIGAYYPEDCGNYYAWGLTNPDARQAFCSSNYSYLENPLNLPSYADVASKIGKGWRMPTMEDFYELKEYCEWTWTHSKGFAGYNITGRNGNTIFLPASGYRYREPNEGFEYTYKKQMKKERIVRKFGDLKNGNIYGYYWSSSLNSQNSTEKACCLYFGKESYNIYVANRYLGLTIRPVYSPVE